MHGTTDPAPRTHWYYHGESVTVTALAYRDYYFGYWVLDGTSVEGNPITITMDSDHTLKACFEYGPPTVGHVQYPT